MFSTPAGTTHAAVITSSRRLGTYDLSSKSDLKSSKVVPTVEGLAAESRSPRRNVVRSRLKHERPSLAHLLYSTCTGIRV
jgi:hypothetical protein